MPSNMNISYADYDGEVGRVSVNIPEIASDGSNFAAVWTSVQALKVAIDGVTRGVATNRSLTRVDKYLNVFATDQNADREDKWLVSYTDVTAELAAGVPNPGYGKRFAMEIPTADLDLRIANSEVVFPTQNSIAAIGTLVVAIEAHMVSPYGGEVRVDKIVSVSRAT